MKSILGTYTYIFIRFYRAVPLFRCASIADYSGFEYLNTPLWAVPATSELIEVRLRVSSTLRNHGHTLSGPLYRTF